MKRLPNPQMMLSFAIILALLSVQTTTSQARQCGNRLYLPFVSQSVSPAAPFSVSSLSGTAPLDLTFDASTNSPNTGAPLSYSWNFGDGQPPASGMHASHTYTQAGSYTATLTVVNSQNTTSQSSTTIEVRSPAFLTKNVIILLGDGMGPEQIKAAGMYLHGAAGTLPFESFLYQAQMTTYSANSAITDSAAAATAMATGHKVNNGVISQAIPADSSHAYGTNLYTVLEYARDHAMSTGLVTTSYITDATPAAFSAHAASRTDTTTIANVYLTQTCPNALYGGGASGMTVANAQSAGYSVVTDAMSLSGLATGHPAFVSGQFGAGAMPYEQDGMGSLPHLSNMAASALNLLDYDPDGFFVLIEGGNIDHAGHINDLPRMLGEMKEFANTVQSVAGWAKNHPSTLIIVLADHETGGLTVLQNNGEGNYPIVSWSTMGHTATNVSVYLDGTTVQNFPALLDNTQIPGLITGGKFAP